METLLENGLKVKTPNGIGMIIGRRLYHGVIISVLVIHAWLKETNPPVCYSYPVDKVKIIITENMN